MKKLFALAIIAVLAMAMAACAPSEEPAEQETPAEKPAPAKPAPAKPADDAKPAEGDDAKPAEGDDVEKKEMAGLGVIFVTDLKKGIFRVKADGENLVDHTFEGGSGMMKKEVRVERELKLAAGEHKMKFVVVDTEEEAKGFKEHVMIFEPKSHHVVKIKAKGGAKNIAMEILE